MLGTTNAASPYYHTSTANAIGSYIHSGGGTGFDLAQSGFESIQYVRVESNATYRDGEIDAFAAVRPMQVGEALSITPDNATAGTSLFFQSEADVTRTAILGDGQFASGANKFMRAPFDSEGDDTFNGRWAGTQGYRHRKMTNVAFCDGHAESLRERFTNTDDYGGPANIAPGTGFLSPDNRMYGGH